MTFVKLASIFVVTFACLFLYGVLGFPLYIEIVAPAISTLRGGSGWVSALAVGVTGRLPEYALVAAFGILASRFNAGLREFVVIAVSVLSCDEISRLLLGLKAYEGSWQALLYSKALLVPGLALLAAIYVVSGRRSNLPAPGFDVSH